MRPYYAIVRGVRHESTPIVLPDGRLGTPVDIVHAPCCLTQPMFWMCQFSRHEDETGHVVCSDPVYAAATIPINWANRFREVQRRWWSESRWL